jgi:hypothetical protein
LWQLSLAHHERHGPAEVLRWSPTVHRRIEAIRDRIMRDLGTSEPLIEDLTGIAIVSRQWRKPLSIEEVNQMAPTPEVRERPGRA